jgi:hypothetical protein
MIHRHIVLGASLAMAVTACSPAPRPQLTESIESPIAGQPICIASYSLLGREAFTPDQFDAIGDEAFALAGAYMKTLYPDSTVVKIQEIVALDFDRRLFSVTFTRVCDSAAGAQSRFLEFMHTGTPTQKLPRGVTLELEAMTQEIAPGAGTPSVGHTP